jgi:hypothetical protein
MLQLRFYSWAPKILVAMFPLLNQEAIAKGEARLFRDCPTKSAPLPFIAIDSIRISNLHGFKSFKPIL